MSTASTTFSVVNKYVRSIATVVPKMSLTTTPLNSEQKHTTTKYVAGGGTQLRSFVSASLVHRLPMKVGTKLDGLGIYKDKDVPVVLERDEYPDWVADLAKPLPSLAQLRRMDIKDATEADKHRLLKLERKIKIKRNNDEMRGTKG